MDFLRSFVLGIQTRYNWTVNFFRSLQLRRRLWTPQVDEEPMVETLDVDTEGIDAPDESNVHVNCTLSTDTSDKTSLECSEE